MSTDEAAQAGQLLAALFQASDDAKKAREDLHTALRENGYLSRVTLHRYMCAQRGCQIATVFKAGGTVLCAVRDYRLSRGLNERRSVASARAKNTLDGERHWPSHVYDVTELADWGGSVGFDLTCNHFTGTLLAADVMKAVDGVEPGRPGKPTRL